MTRSARLAEGRDPRRKTAAHNRTGQALLRPVLRPAGGGDACHPAARRAGGLQDSGDRQLRKEFPGGRLVKTGPNSAVGLRSMSARVLFLDKVDAYPGDVEGEGDPVALALGLGVPPQPAGGCQARAHRGRIIPSGMVA